MSEKLGPVEIEFTIPEDFGKQADAAIKKMSEFTRAASDAPKASKAAVLEQKEVIKIIEADIKNLEKALKDVAPGKAKQEVLSELNAAKKALAEESAALNQLDKQTSTTANSSQRLMYQIRDITDQLAKMRVAGQEGTDAYRQLESKAASLSQSLNETRQAVRNLSNDQQNIKGLAEGVTGLAGAFSAGTGVVGLFAGENENLAKIQTRVQSLMSITIGLQQVTNVLDKESAFMTVTVVKAKQMWASAEKALTAALWGSNVAAKALMGTLTLGLAVAIPVLISLYDKFKTRQQEAAEIQREATRIQTEANIEAGKSRIEMDMLISRIENFSGSKQAEKAMIEELNKKYGDTFGTYKTLAQWLDTLKQKANDYVEIMMLQAQIQGKVQRAQSLDEKATTIKSNNSPQDFLSGWDKAKAFVAQGLGLTGSLVNIGMKGAKLQDSALADIEDEKDKILEEAKDLQRQLLELQDESGINIFGIDNGKKDEAYAQYISKVKGHYQNYALAVEMGQAEVAKILKTQLPEGLENYDAFINSELDKATKSGDKEKLNALLPESAAIQEKLKELVAKYATYADQRKAIEQGYNAEIRSLTEKGFLEQAAIAEKRKEQALKELDASQPLAKMLEEYKTYDDQILDLRKDSAEKIRQMEEKGYFGEAQMLRQATENKVEAIEQAKLKASAEWAYLWEESGNMSKQALEDLINQTKMKMEELKGSLTPEDLKALTEMLEKLNKQYEKKATETVTTGNPFEDVFSYAEAASKAERGTKEFNEAVNQTIDQVNKAAEEIRKYGNEIISVFVQLGVVSQEQADGMSSMLDSYIELTNAQSEMGSGILTGDFSKIISGGLKMLDNVLKTVDVKTRRIDKEQSKLLDQVKEMDLAYRQLQEAVDNALGTDVYAAQADLIKANAAQIQKYQELIDAEYKKKAKKRNEENITAWKEAQQELLSTNAEIQDSITEELTQTNARDFSEQLADALVGAYERGEDAAVAWGEVTRQVLANAVKHALMLKFIEGPINSAIEQMGAEMGANGGILSPERVQYWTNVFNGIGQNAEKGFEPWKDFLESMGDTKDEASSTMKGIANMSQETGSALLGQFTALRISAATSADIAREEQAVRQSMKALLQVIADNTYYCRRLDTIDRTLSSMLNDGIKIR